METLKLKFELNALKFEIEGREDVVREEFKDFKDFTQGLATKINLLKTQETEITYDKKNLLDFKNSIDDFPLLKDILLQDLPKTESEWILVIAFYESHFGQNSFKREFVLEKYRGTDRYTNNNGKNFSVNFKKLVQDKFIKSKNEEEFIFTNDGKSEAVKIINGDNGSLKSKSSLKKSSKETGKTAPKSVSTLQPLKDLNLRPEGKISLKDYANQFEFQNSEEVYLIITYYLKETLSIEQITLNHIFTCLIELDKKVPTHLKQVLINFKNNGTNHWLDTENFESINYSIRGMNHIKHDIKRKTLNE